MEGVPGAANRPAAGQCATSAEPRLGDSVDEVLDRFAALAHEWAGIGIVEACVVVSRNGPAITFRWTRTENGGRQLGVSTGDGWLIRDARDFEYDELEAGLRQGFVQITLNNRVARTKVVLHRATGRPMNPQ